MAQLSKNTLITRTIAANAVAAAGSSAVDGLAGASVDMVTYEGAYFIQVVGGGSTGGATSFSVRQSTAAITSMTSGGQGTALSGTTSTIAAGSSATAEAFVVDVYRPRSPSGNRFLFGQVTIASSCTVLGPQFVIQYGPRNANNSTAAGTVPATTASALGITGGVVAAVSPSSSPTH